MNIYDDVIGKTIDDKYHIKKFLGYGGFGYVFHAEHRIFDLFFRDVALKIFTKEQVRAATAKDAFNDAIILARILDQAKDMAWKQHIVGVYDIGLLMAFGHRGFIAMELIEGTDLGREIRRFSPLPLQKIIDYTKQICRGMSVVHQFNPPIVHRDIKPANILISTDGTVKIGDFGLATAVDKILGDAASAGTLSYQPPESLLRGSAIPASDVYAIGLTLYEMLTGEAVFGDVGAGQVESTPEGQQHLRNQHLQMRKIPLPPPSAKHPELRARDDRQDLDAIVLRCLAYSPVDRYQNAQELLQAIEAYDQGRVRQATTSLTARERRALALEALRREGEVAEEKGDYAGAIQYWSKALEQEDSNSDLLFRLGKAYKKVGNYDQAIQVLQKGLELKKKGRAYLDLAEAYEKKGMKGIALAMRAEAKKWPA